MNTLYVSIHDCKPFMVTAEAIYNEFGVLIVAENTPLNDYIIDKLRNLGIRTIKIYKENVSLKERKTEVFISQYENSVNNTKEIFHSLSKGNNVDIGTVEKLTDSFTENDVEKRDIINCVNQVRKMDEYTYYHCINVSMIAYLIGGWLKLGKTQQKLLAQAGMLHDIGKSKISLSILNKPGELDDEELAVMKTHPVLGYRLIENNHKINNEVKKSVLMHHERCDGSGYPVGLKGNAIPLYAKILAVADVFDAMTSKRVYKQSNSPFTVFQMFEDCSFGILDTVVLNTFLNNITSYYIGEKVKLSNNEIGEIIYINPMRFSKPVLKIGNKYVDLSQNPTLKIVEIL